MKSIKEKAEEYGYINWQSDEYYDGASEGLEFDPIGHTQKTFKAGANYVLDAIQSCIDRHEDGCLALEAIILTIDELKRNNHGIPQ